VFACYFIFVEINDYLGKMSYETCSWRRSQAMLLIKLCNGQTS